jgi:hypothetical protein
MKLFEISAEIERLKNIRATTPAVASYNGSKNTTELGSSADVEVAEKKVSKAPKAVAKPVAKGVVSAKSKGEMKPVAEKRKMTSKMMAEKPVEKVVRSKKVAEAVAK